jgi:hypothetical protein
MARRTHRWCRIDFKFNGKVVALMRNNGRTSVIDYGGYRSSFDSILFPLVRFLASHDRHRV